jgi:undecaprenyl diphosphate synthase
MKGKMSKGSVKSKQASELRGESREKPLPLKHVAIIMDGNRRWADQKGMPRLLGHREGVKSLKRLVEHVGRAGLKYLTVYAFSSENWQRSTEEVQYLLELFGKVLAEEFSAVRDNQIKLTFIGQLDKIPPDLAKSLRKAMEATKDNSQLSLQVALNYGSRLEITEAVKKIAASVSSGKVALDEIDESLVQSYLYTSGIPDPELIIRTGGDMRLSNYLLWQAAYAEIYITDTLWPDFSPEDFDKAVHEFERRERRYGGD